MGKVLSVGQGWGRREHGRESPSPTLRQNMCTCVCVCARVSQRCREADSTLTLRVSHKTFHPWSQTEEPDGDLATGFQLRTAA